MNDAHTHHRRRGLGRLRPARPGLGRPRDRRGQDDRHLLPAELPGAAAEARECRILPRRRRRPRRRLSRLPALPARRGEPRGGRARARRSACSPRRRKRRRWTSWRRRSAIRRTISTACSSAPPASRRRPMRAACGRSGPRRPGRQRAGSPTPSTMPAIRGPGRFYADARSRLGMTPSAWRDGGRGETIRWATAETDLGTMLVAATEQGHLPALVRRGRGRAARGASPMPRSLMAARRWPTSSGARSPRSTRRKSRTICRSTSSGTAFQEAVWRELTPDPAGRDAHLCPDRRRGRPAGRGARGGLGERRQQCRGADPLPPRHPHRRHARRLCLWARAQGAAARAGAAAGGRAARPAPAARCVARRHRPAARWAAAAASRRSRAAGRRGSCAPRRRRCRRGCSTPRRSARTRPIAAPSSR